MIVFCVLLSYGNENCFTLIFFLDMIRSMLAVEDDADAFTMDNSFHKLRCEVNIFQLKGRIFEFGSPDFDTNWDVRILA